MTTEVYKMIIQKYSYTIHTELLMALNLLFRINKDKKRPQIAHDMLYCIISFICLIPYSW